MYATKDEQPNRSHQSISVDYRIIALVLFVALIVSIVLWKPWASKAQTRKITITGTATIKGTPDEYQLSPYFEYTGDHAANARDAAATASQVTAKLKELGVKDAEIASSTSSYDKYNPNGAADGQETYQLNYTIKLSNKDLAQKVQDYFLGTAAKGQLSPYATFSQNKQKELEAQARQNAIDDAKAKAEKTASQVGAKVGKVVTISDESSGGIIRPYAMSAEAGAALDASGTTTSMPIQSGQNDFTTSVQVEYELR